MPGGKAPDRTRGTSANEANGCGSADTRDMRTATACPPAGRTQNDSAGGSGPDYFLCGKTPVRLCYKPEGAELGGLLKRYFIGLKEGEELP